MTWRTRLPQSRRMTLATFAHPDDALAATRALRAAGYPVRDVYSPHPIHGIEDALGLPPSRLTWVCFAGGLLGVVGMLWFQHWANAVDWPLNVGGKPWNSLPAEVPVAFEMGVLLAAFGSVAACLAVCGLRPGKQPDPLALGATDDQYVVAIDESLLAAQPRRLHLLLKSHGAREISERLVNE